MCRSKLLCFFLLLTCVIFAQKRSQGNSLESSSLHQLVTGVYRVSDTPNAFKRVTVKYPDTLYIDPVPLVTVNDFKEVRIDNSDGFGMMVFLKKRKKKVWADATANNIDRKVAVIINDTMVMAPRIRASIKKGRFQIANGFSKVEQKKYMDRLAEEMNK